MEESKILLSAEEFVERIKAASNSAMDLMAILTVENVIVHEEILISGLIFQGELNLLNVELSKIKIHNCTFSKNFVVRGCVIEKLAIEDSINENIKIYNTTITYLKISICYFQDILINSSTIKGEIKIAVNNSPEIAKDMEKRSRIFLTGCNIVQGLTCAELFLDTIDFQNTKVGGNIRIYNSSINRKFELTDIDVKGLLSIVDGNGELLKNKERNSISCNVKIKRGSYAKGININNKYIEGGIRFSEIRNFQNIRLKDCSFIELQLPSIKSGSQFEISNSFFQKLQLK
jgi:hypothetical protein